MNNQKILPRFFPKSSLAAVISTVALPALAENFLLEEIVVTAERRAESAQEVPLAITALGSEALERQGFQSGFDIASQIPNVNIEQGSSFSGGNIAIRGIASSEFAATANQPVLSYVDDVVVSSVHGSGQAIFDNERIEVLRGPQGTLFGRNATSGAIQYISNKPTEVFEGYAKATVGNFDRVTVEGAVSGPLIENSLLGRLSFISNEEEGDIENDYAGGKLRGNDYRAIRGWLTWLPSDRLSVSLKYQHFDLDAGYMSINTLDELTSVAAVMATDFGVPISNPGPDSDFEHVASDVEGYELIRSNLASFHIDYDLDEYSIASITGYSNYDRELLFDNDGLPITLLSEYQPDGGGETWSQEVRISSNSDSDLQWIGGAFYLQESISNRIIFDASDLFLLDSFDTDTMSFDSLLAAGAASAGDTLIQQDVKTWAAFFHTTYDWTDRLRSTHAVRWTREEKDYSHSFNRGLSFARGDRSVFTEGIGVPTNGQKLKEAIDSESFVYVQDEVIRNQDEAWEEATWRLAMDYHLSDEKLLYASISSGFKSGGFNGAATDPNESSVVDPETLVAYEIGAKTYWFDGDLKVNGSVFYYDYSDYQFQQVIDSGNGQVLSQLINLGDAEVFGAELEVVANPIENLVVSIGLGYTDAQITDVSPNGDQRLEGNELPYAQEWGINGTVVYDIPMDYGTLSPSLSWNTRGPYFNDIDNVESKLGRYTIFDARIDWIDLDGDYTLSFWAKNLTDEKEIIQRDLDENGLNNFSTDAAQITRSRTFGASLKVNF